MTTDGGQASVTAETLLARRQVLDIDSYGWSGPDEIDQEFVGYAMWSMNPRYEHDFAAWQEGKAPARAPNDQECSLAERAEDFFGLMKTARHFVGNALIHQPGVPPVRMDAVPFDFAEFAALTALVAAADRLRDFFIITLLGTKTDERDQLDKAYAVLRAQGFGAAGDELRKLASPLSVTLRKARHEAVHGLATQPARVQRRLLQMDRQASAAGGWGVSAVGFDEGVRVMKQQEVEERAAVEERVTLLCDSYRRLVKLGADTFRLEYDWRHR